MVRMFAKRPFQYNLPRYYPPIQEMDSLVKRLRHKGLYRDEHLDFNEMMAEQRTARGKGKPRKGDFVLYRSFCLMSERKKEREGEGERERERGRGKVHPDVVWRWYVTRYVG